MALADFRARLVAPTVVLFLALLAAQAAVLVLTPILVEVAHDFGVSTSAAGQVRTLTGLVAGVSALAVGRVFRGVALRDLLLGGAGLLALGSLLSAAAPSFTVFVLAQVPVGVAIAVLVSSGAAAAGEWAQPGGGNRLLSSTLLGPPMAWVIGMPLVGIAAERSWRLGFLVFPLVASVVVALALSMCRKERLPAVRPLVRLRDLLGDPTVGGWALAELLASSAWAGTLVYAGALFVESFDASPALTGLVLAGAERDDADDGFDAVLTAKIVVVGLLVVTAYLHDFVLGPRLQKEIREGREQRTRPLLVYEGWAAFTLTIAAPVLGVVLSHLS